MPLTIPAGMAVASFDFLWTGDPEPMVVTLGVRAVAPPLTEEHANRLFDAWVANVLPSQTNAVTLTGVTLRVQDEGPGTLVIENSVGNPTAGGTAGASLPQNSAYLARKLTARAGRRGRGRMFIPGVPEANVDNVGALSTSQFNVLSTALSDFLADLLAASGTAVEPVQPVLFHGNTTTTTRTSGAGVTTITVTEGAAGPLPDDITGFQLDARVATQRRRLR